MSLLAPQNLKAQEDKGLEAFAYSCITFARQISFWQPPQSARAIDLPAPSIAPRLGGWILFKAGKNYSADGHAGVVLRISTSTATIVEGNFKKNQITVREIRLDDKELRGFYP